MVEMKILYSVQATGNGHISRAEEVIPELGNYGEVDVLLSGSNSTLTPSFDVKYRTKGLSLFYKKCGRLNHKKLIKNCNIRRIRTEVLELPVEKYDLIINDFDFITSMACKWKNKKSIQLGHQASFVSRNTPRPQKKSFIGELVLSNYAISNDNFGFHFEKYDRNIFYPIVKKSIINATPSDEGHISIYLPSVNINCMYKTFNWFSDHKFHVFTPQVNRRLEIGNITYFPVDNRKFTTSLIGCHGLVTGGGFETPAEALVLGKKLMCIPIKNHYEQKCNTEALRRKGVFVKPYFNEHRFLKDMKEWFNYDQGAIEQKYSNVKEVVGEVVNSCIESFSLELNW